MDLKPSTRQFIRALWPPPSSVELRGSKFLGIACAVIFIGTYQSKPNNAPLPTTQGGKKDNRFSPSTPPASMLGVLGRGSTPRYIPMLCFAYLLLVKCLNNRITHITSITNTVSLMLRNIRTVATLKSSQLSLAMSLIISHILLFYTSFINIIFYVI